MQIKFEKKIFPNFQLNLRGLLEFVSSWTKIRTNKSLSRCMCVAHKYNVPFSIELIETQTKNNKDAGNIANKNNKDAGR